MELRKPICPMHTCAYTYFLSIVYSFHRGYRVFLVKLFEIRTLLTVTLYIRVHYYSPLLGSSQNLLIHSALKKKKIKIMDISWLKDVIKNNTLSLKRTCIYLKF